MSKSYRYLFQSADGFETSTYNYELDTEDERYDAAIQALSRHCAMDDEWIEVETDDEDAGTTYLYRSVADADDDLDGSHADAWVKRITVTDEE